MLYKIDVLILLMWCKGIILYVILLVVILILLVKMILF